jgi:hypothetical protein
MLLRPQCIKDGACIAANGDEASIMIVDDIIACRKVLVLMGYSIGPGSRGVPLQGNNLGRSIEGDALGISTQKRRQLGMASPMVVQCNCEIRTRRNRSREVQLLFRHIHRIEGLRKWCLQSAACARGEELIVA